MTRVQYTIVLGLLLWGATLAAQEPGAPRQLLQRVPAMLQRQLTALGDRMQAPGKEQSMYVGEVVDQSGKRSHAQVMYQLPNLVRLQGFGNAQAVLSFDGQTAVGAVSAGDQLLLETFVMDLPEGMLTSVRAAAAVRLLGRGFGPDPRTTKNYTGPRFDIIEVTGPVPSRSDGLVRSKLYYFDSQTGLLQRTRYYDYARSTPLALETRFTDWRTIDGSAYPGQIDHYAGGQLVFSFRVAAITAAPPVDPATFQ